MDEVHPNMIYTFYSINILSYGRDGTIHNGNSQSP